MHDHEHTALFYLLASFRTHSSHHLLLLLLLRPSAPFPCHGDVLIVFSPGRKSIHYMKNAVMTGTRRIARHVPMSMPNTKTIQRHIPMPKVHTCAASFTS